MTVVQNQHAHASLPEDGIQEGTGDIHIQFFTVKVSLINL